MIHNPQHLRLFSTMRNEVTACSFIKFSFFFSQHEFAKSQLEVHMEDQSLEAIVVVFFFSTSHFVLKVFCGESQNTQRTFSETEN